METNVAEDISEKEFLFACHFILLRPLIDWMSQPTLERHFVLLNLSIQMRLIPRNSFIDPSEEIVLNQSWHSVAQAT